EVTNGTSDGGGGSVQNQPEPAGVGVVFVAGYEGVLRAGGFEGDEQTRFVAAHSQTMRHVLGKRGVRAGVDVDPLVTDEGGNRAVEDIEGLVFARVGVDWGVPGGRPPPFYA